MSLEKCFPKCKGIQGYEYDLTSTVVIVAIGWTKHDEPEAGGDAHRTHDGVSLFRCLNCGQKMRESTVMAIRDMDDGN